MNLRRALWEDLPYILQLERQYRELGFLGGDDPAKHEQQLSDPDCAYWIVETDAAAGFVILRGLRSINKCIELKRIAIAEPGRGLGRQVLARIMDMAFNEMSAHRLWLDVFEHNARARHVYRSVGFVEEGKLRESIKYGDLYRTLVLMSILEQEYRALAADHQAPITTQAPSR